MQETESYKLKQESFLKLYEPVHARLARYCRAMLRNREEAREMISETLLTAYEKFDNLRSDEAFLHFLIGIASRKIKNSYRRKKFLGVFSLSVAENIQDNSMHPEDSTDLGILYEALAKLPEKQRECIVLYEISGMSLEEISALNGEKLATVKSHIHRGRNKLKDVFGTDGKIKHISTGSMLQFSGTKIETIPASLKIKSNE